MVLSMHPVSDCMCVSLQKQIYFYSVRWWGVGGEGLLEISTGYLESYV
jgi:hypothetical protein